MGQAALNIKEEVGNSAADLAKVIASANMTSDAVAPQKETFVRVKFKFEDEKVDDMTA